MSARDRRVVGDFQLWTIDHPVAGVAVLVGLLLSIYMLPMDIASPDALRFSTLLFIGSLCFVPCLAMLRDPKSIFRAEHVLVTAPVYWILLDPLQGRVQMPGVSQEDVT